jgi:hypothetical protein
MAMFLNSLVREVLTLWNLLSDVHMPMASVNRLERHQFSHLGGADGRGKPPVPSLFPMASPTLIYRS